MTGLCSKLPGPLFLDPCLQVTFGGVCVALCQFHLLLMGPSRTVAPEVLELLSLFQWQETSGSEKAGTYSSMDPYLPRCIQMNVTETSHGLKNLK